MNVVVKGGWLLAFALVLSAPVKASTDLGDEGYAADDVVEFRIAKGTGQGAWNAKDQAVKVKVGQVLRIVNDDTIAHYLHTPGRPCPHGTGPFGPGKSYDCKVTKTANPDKAVLYDHQFGPKSRFYVEATE